MDPRLLENTHFLMNLELSQVRLMDNSLFPWVVLIPMRANIIELIDLTHQEQHLLLDEISQISEHMKEIFTPDKLNIATLGNIVPQLHIHIIARYKNDAAWPNPVFGINGCKYSESKLKLVTQKLLSTHTSANFNPLNNTNRSKKGANN